MAFQVELVLRIVPIPDMKKPFHGIPCKVFQNRRADHTEEIDQPEIVTHANGAEENHNCAAAINGQKGSVHKSTVDPLSGSD